ncbi:hypothetical protein [Streptomyces sp. NPDC001401]|uniref:hypothetical protein n=1 Tax=Streptomyces sp. NPDC001401 TaxID=3364570 RepID=UPI0036C3ED27
MTGIEVAVGYVCAYLVRKARRAAGKADAEVDRLVDAATEKVHDVVSRALGDDPALQRAGAEAATETGEVSVLTRRRVADALTAAAQDDADLAAALDAAVREAQSAVQAAGGAVASDEGVAIAGNVSNRADRGSVAAQRVGDVTIGNVGLGNRDTGNGDAGTEAPGNAGLGNPSPPGGQTS